jgi:hypothetical protein
MASADATKITFFEADTVMKTSPYFAKGAYSSVQQKSGLTSLGISAALEGRKRTDVLDPRFSP